MNDDKNEMNEKTSKLRDVRLKHTFVSAVINNPIRFHERIPEHNVDAKQKPTYDQQTQL